MRLVSKPNRIALGFTLVELLVAVAIGAVIVASGAVVIVAHIRTTGGQEAALRLKDHWGRVNYFLETEVREARTIGYDTGAGCPAPAAGSNLVFCLFVPSQPDGSATETISYSINANGELVRTGPPITPEGRLTFGSSSSSVLVDNANLVVNLATSNQREPVYTLTLTDPSTGSIYSRTSSVRTRVRSF